MTSNAQSDFEAGARTALACGLGAKSAPKAPQRKSVAERISDYLASADRSASTQRVPQDRLSVRTRSFPSIGRPYTRDEINASMSGVSLQGAQTRGLSRQGGSMSRRYIMVGTEASSADIPSIGGVSAPPTSSDRSDREAGAAAARAILGK